MNKAKILLCVFIIVAGNIAYHFMSSYAAKYYYSGLAVASYAVLILTYLLAGLIPNLPPIIKSRLICFVLDMALVLIIVFPFVFPSVEISLFLLEARIYIAASVLLGYFLRSTVKLQKKS